MWRLAPLLLLLLYACGSGEPSESELKKKALAALETVLVDARSARFQGLRQVRTAKGEDIICGMVNAKNRVGAYAGYVEFVAASDGSFAAVDPGAGEYSSDEEKAYQGGFDTVHAECLARYRP